MLGRNGRLVLRDINQLQMTDQPAIFGALLVIQETRNTPPVLALWARWRQGRDRILVSMAQRGERRLFIVIHVELCVIFWKYRGKQN